MTIEITQEYLYWVLFFVGGYHIAYLFKNLLTFYAEKGVIVFMFAICWLTGVCSYFLPALEVQTNWILTASYTVGFIMRFVRYDA